MRRRGVAPAGGVLGEKNIAGAEIHACPIAKPDIDVAGERDHPAAPRRAVKFDDVRAKSFRNSSPVAGLVPLKNSDALLASNGWKWEWPSSPVYKR